MKTNRWILISLLVLIALGGFLRSYQYDRLLHFELDQSRDAIIISEAIENGPGELPLLGPRAAGTMLRLGPFFYYQEYLSALIFGNTPPAMNFLGILAAVLMIPLLYYFLRHFFQPISSLGATAVFTVSLFAVTYARFPWNPNMLPLLIMGLLISLLGISHGQGKWKTLSIYGAAFCFAIAIQLHFLVFVSLPVLILAWAGWLLLKKWKLKRQTKKPAGRIWLHVVLAFALVLLLNFPVFLNEYLTGGDNTKELIKAFSSKNEKGEDYNLAEKAFRNLGNYAQGYWLLVSGNQDTDLVRLELFGKNQLVNFKCDRACRDRMPLTVVAWIFLIGGWIFFLRALWQEWQGFSKRKGTGEKKEVDSAYSSEFRLDFLIINLLLFGVVFAGFLSVAFNFPPRFLLSTLPVAFVLLAFWLKNIQLLISFAAKKSSKSQAFGTVAVVVLALFLVGLNLYYNQERLRERQSAIAEEPEYFERDIILKEDMPVTLEQEELITTWMLEHSSHETVFVWGPPKYYRPFVYLLNYQTDKDGRRLRYSVPCADADYFAVVGTTSKDDFFDKGGELFESTSEQTFGTLRVHKLKLKDGVAAEAQSCEEDDDEDGSGSYAKRYQWKEVWEALKK